MPTIRRYNSRVNSGSGAVANSSGSFSSASDFGAGTGNELTRLGQQFNRFGEQLEQQKNSRDSLTISKMMVDEETAFAERERGLRKDALPGAAGFTENVRDEMGTLHDKLRGEFTETGLSDANSAKLEIGLARMQSRFMLRAIDFESASQARKVKTDVGDSLDTLLNRVSQDASAYGDALEDATDVIDAAKENGLSEEDANTLADGFLSNATANRFAAKIDAAESPEEVAALRSEMEEFEDDLDPKQFSAILGEIDKAEDKLQAARVYDFSVSLDNHNAAVAAGKPGAGINESIIKATIKNPIAQKKALRSLALARTMGQETLFVESAQPSDIAARHSQLVNSLNSGATGDFKKNQIRLQTFEHAVNRRNKLIKEDVAKYVMNRDEKLTQAATELSENPSPVTMLNYARQQKISQLRLGIPAGDQKLLTKSMMGMIASQLSEDTADGIAEDTSKTVDTIRNTAEFWGEHWPQVHRQLAAEKVLVGTDLALGSMIRADQSAPASDLAAAQIEEPALKKLLTTESKKLIEKETRSQMTQVQRTLPASAQASVAFSSRFDAVKLLAMRYVATGNLSEKEAVTKAANSIVLESYHFIDGDHPFRIPIDVQQSPEEIEEGARLLIRGMDLSKVHAESITGLPKDITQDQMQQVLRDSGGFVTNGNETGLVLVDQFGNKVMRTNEEGTFFIPYSFTWDEVAEAFVDKPVTGPSREGAL